MGSLRARERELHRYYQPWLESFISTEMSPSNFPAEMSPSDIPAEGEVHRPRSSQDKALTAFAQLGCLRLNAKRGVVTLLDAEKQYIIAEATKSLSLLHDSQHDPGDELWFGNSFVPRNQGVSADAMYPEPYTATGLDGESFTAPALVVPDIARHPIYKDRGYAGQGINFYCGVPITTKLGHVIGVYNVTDDQPRQGLTPQELRFMTDMAVIVVQHLEIVKNDRARARGEQLIRGIGTFIEGQSTGLTWPPTPPLRPQLSSRANTGTSELSNDASSLKTTFWHGIEVGDANTIQEDGQDLNRVRLAFDVRPHSGPNQQKQDQFSVTSSSNDTATYRRDHARRPAPARRGTSFADRQQALLQSEHVFDRAAIILRQCLSADGVVFLNASASNLSRGSTVVEQDTSVAHFKHSRVRKRGLRPDPNLTGHPAFERVSDQISQENSSPDSDDSSSRSRTQSDSSTTMKSKSHACEVLGLSQREGTSAFLKVTELSLRRFIRRHPNGKCFSFDEQGNLASTDESSESASAAFEDAAGNPGEASSRGRRIPKSPTQSVLLRAFPGARSIVFLPLWDFSKQRWHSAVMIWSNDPARLMNVQDDMSYLEAFSNAVMNEVNRINLAISDTAKATFLANISHELRSPLHGILGSIEFLHDTAMDDFQSSMVIAVETCGKTLLDTVNHVLDYAKINNLSKQHKSRHLGSSQNQGKDQASTSDSSLVEAFDLAILIEEVVEAVYAGQVFRSANTDTLEGRGPSLSAVGRAMDRRQRDTATISQGSHAVASPVRLTLNIGNHPDWLVRSQPGAVRRIVMNLLGNALKYTDKGTVDIGLQIDPRRRSSSHQIHALVTVRDTGRGMSEDFMKNHAFTAFAQEDSLASGTGLGLSIVRQIVDSLGGQIDLASERGIGTEIKVWLSFPLVKRQRNEESSLLVQVRERTRNMDMCFLRPQLTNMDYDAVVQGISKMPTVESSMKHLVAQWLRMSVTVSPTMENITTSFFLFPEPPPIDYLIEHHGLPAVNKEVPIIILCSNAFEAASLRTEGIHRLTEIGRIIEIIAQPCGPQKLAKVLHRAMQRVQNSHSEGRSAKYHPLLAPRRFEEAVVTLKSPTNPPLTPQGEQSISTWGTPNLEGSNFEMPSRRLSTARKQSLQESELSSEPYRDEHLHPRGLSPHAATGSAPSTSPASPPPAAARVLVVDDNAINLHLLVTFVRKALHPYTSAVNGAEAVEIYKQACLENNGRDRYKYILMDINMPVMNGIVATQMIRSFEKETNIGSSDRATIIALTGLGSDEAQEDALQAGFDTFLSKPIKFKDLQKLLL